MNAPAISLGDHEPVVRGALAALPADAWWVPGPREAPGAAIPDVPEAREEPMRRGARPFRVAPVLGAERALVAVGLTAGGAPALVHLAAASAASGSAAEAFALAVARRAPVVFLVAFHPLAGVAPLIPLPSPAPAARAAGLEIAEVDGSSADAVSQAVREAFATGRPTLILATLHVPEEPAHG